MPSVAELLGRPCGPRSRCLTTGPLGRADTNDIHWACASQLFQSEDFFKKKPKSDKPKANKPSAPAFKFSAPKFSAPKVSAPNVDISLPGPANDKQEAALVGGIAVLAAALTSSVVGGLTKRS